MGFVAEIDAESARAGALPESGGSGEFPPLTPGKYQARVRKVKGVEKFGGTGDNSQKNVLAIEVQVLDESPNGAKRVYHPRIPLFTKFASGKDASAFTGFWRDAIGWDQARLLAGDLPGENDILGKQITITLGAPKAPDQWNLLGSNEVAFFSAAGDINATPTAKVNVPWLTAEGKLDPSFSPAATAAVVGQQQAAPSAPPVWGAPPAAAPAADAFAPAPGAAPVADVWNTPATPPAGAWAPAAADVAYAAQAPAQ